MPDFRLVDISKYTGQRVRWMGTVSNYEEGPPSVVTVVLSSYRLEESHLKYQVELNLENPPPPPAPVMSGTAMRKRSEPRPWAWRETATCVPSGDQAALPAFPSRVIRRLPDPSPFLRYTSLLPA